MTDDGRGARWGRRVVLLVLFGVAVLLGVQLAGPPGVLADAAAATRSRIVDVLDRDDDAQGAAEAAAARSPDAASTAAAEPSESAPPPPPVPRHRLRMVTRPRAARVTITPAVGGDEITGTTPFAARVPEGRATVTVTHRGRQPLTRRVRVAGDRTVRWWLDPAGQLHHKVAQFRVGSAPKQVAFTPDRRQLWVTLLGGPGVEVFRPRTGRKLATIDLGDHGAVEVIFTADGTTAYVSQMESASVYEVDTETFTVRRRLPTGGSWTKVMALAPSEDVLYASNWSSNDVSEIDLRTGEVRRRLPTVATPRGLYVSPDGATLYVSGFEGGDLQRFDLADGSSTVLTSTGGAMRHLVGDGDRLYADDMGTDAVYVHRLGRRQVRKLADTDEKPNTIDLGAGGRTLYVSNRGENNPESYYLPGPEWGSVVVLDARTGAPLDAIVGGNQTTGLDVSDDGRLLAFSDFLDDRVQVYEIPGSDVLMAGDGGYFGPHRRALVK